MNLFYTFTMFVLLRESSSKQNSNRGQAKFPRPFVSNFSDIRIGGLFPIHIRESNDSLCDLRVPKYSYILDHDRIPRCYRLNNAGVIWSETLRFSVEAMRPGFFNVTDVTVFHYLGFVTSTNLTLGYDIRDSLNNVDVALEAALDYTLLRSRKPDRNSSQKCSCNDNTTEPYIVTLIGGARSEISQRVNAIAGVSSLPQISYSSTSVSLSNKEAYRTFMRTIPPDNYQARAMVDIVKHFNWSYVATVATDEDYGRGGVEVFNQLARRYNICISLERLFHFNISSEDTKQEIRSIVRDLKKNERTNVIVLFCERPRAVAVLKEAQKQGLTGKTWIATEDWGFSDSVYDFDLSTVGGMVGIVTHTPTVPIFEQHLRKFNLTMENPWILEYVREHDFNVTALNLTRSKTSYIMDAAYTVALGLLEYMNCTKTKPKTYENCNSSYIKNIDLERLRMYMLQVNITGSSSRLLSYNEDGNPEVIYYNISNLQPSTKNKKGKSFVFVGSWSNGLLKIRSPIYWNGGRNTTPVSVCSFPCPGMDCILCPPGQFKVGIGPNQCEECPNGFTSDSNRTRCLRIPEEFIRWDSATAAVLTSFSVFENTSICHVQPIAFGLLMTLASSLVLTKTFRLIQIFNNVVTNIKDKSLVTMKTQFLMVFVLLVIEAILIAVMVDVHPIKLQFFVRETAVPIGCNDSARDLHTAVLLYNWLLSMVCAIMAFRARSLPANFSEARLITYAMFSFSVIWLSFIIVFTGSILDRFAIYICVAILATAVDLLACMFAPKIYVILFKPELNQMEVVRADIYRYTMKQRARSLSPNPESSETQHVRNTLDGTLPRRKSAHSIQDAKL
ncbi:extracellular calcium-sensing receptor-like [Xenia sp. Carnegie-2017]|uniref:extracellular calcium-sensing receptor-like n=1 Tax=Xenia sp. Carnegie-2017 TaxID=2897299 RepID=UPI001F034CB6|nr:extracellular calcium-sensing receptor-like [Xenia sp. Carnegie-2017]